MLIDKIKSLATAIAADIKAIKAKVDGFKSDENGFLKTATSNLNPPDVTVNSIKAGVTSPKIAFKVINVPITLSAFNYNPDGSFMGEKWQSSIISVSAPHSIKSSDILSLSLRLYVKSGSSHISEREGMAYSGKYYRVVQSASGYLLYIRSQYHVENDTSIPLNQSGQHYFDNDTYVELFVTYRVE